MNKTTKATTMLNGLRTNQPICDDLIRVLCGLPVDRAMLWHRFRADGRDIDREVVSALRGNQTLMIRLMLAQYSAEAAFGLSRLGEDMATSALAQLGLPLLVSHSLQEEQAISSLKDWVILFRLRGRLGQDDDEGSLVIHKIWVKQDNQQAVETLLGLRHKDAWPQVAKSAKSIWQFCAPNLSACVHWSNFDKTSVMVMPEELGKVYDGAIHACESVVKAALASRNQELADKPLVGSTFIGRLWTSDYHWKGGIVVLPDEAFPDGVNFIVYGVKHDIQPRIRGCIFALNSGRLGRANKVACTDLQTLLNNVSLTDPAVLDILGQAISCMQAKHADIKAMAEERLGQPAEPPEVSDIVGYRGQTLWNYWFETVRLENHQRLALMGRLGRTERAAKVCQDITAMGFPMFSFPKLAAAYLSRCLDGRLDPDRTRISCSLMKEGEERNFAEWTYPHAHPGRVLLWAWKKAGYVCPDEELDTWVRAGSKLRQNGLYTGRNQAKELIGRWGKDIYLSRSPSTFSGGSMLEMRAIDCPKGLGGVWWVAPQAKAVTLVFAYNDGADEDDGFIRWMGPIVAHMRSWYKTHKCDLDVRMIDEEERRIMVESAKLEQAEHWLTESKRPWRSWLTDSESAKLGLKKNHWIKAFEKVQQILDLKVSMATRPMDPNPYMAYDIVFADLQQMAGLTGQAANMQMLAAAQIQGLVDFGMPPHVQHQVSRVVTSQMLSDIIDAENQGKRLDHAAKAFDVLLSAYGYIAWYVTLNKPAVVKLPKRMVRRAPGLPNPLSDRQGLWHAVKVEPIDWALNTMIDRHVEWICKDTASEIKDALSLGLIRTLGQMAATRLTGFEVATRQRADQLMKRIVQYDQEVRMAAQQADMTRIGELDDAILLETAKETTSVQSALLWSIMASRWSKLNEDTKVIVQFTERTIRANGFSDRYLWLDEIVTPQHVVIHEGNWRKTLCMLAELQTQPEAPRSSRVVVSFYPATMEDRILIQTQFESHAFKPVVRPDGTEIHGHICTSGKRAMSAGMVNPTLVAASRQAKLEAKIGGAVSKSAYQTYYEIWRDASVTSMDFFNEEGQNAAQSVQAEIILSQNVVEVCLPGLPTWLEADMHPYAEEWEDTYVEIPEDVYGQIFDNPAIDLADVERAPIEDCVLEEA